MPFRRYCGRYLQQLAMVATIKIEHLPHPCMHPANHFPSLSATMCSPRFLGVLGLLLFTSQTVWCGEKAAKGYDEEWFAGHATWYGEPIGEGSSGGACGYKQLEGTPYGTKIAAGNEAVFEGGQGCGKCYDIKCTHGHCKEDPTRVVITDLCPGGKFCSGSEPAFDFSGAAITSLARGGKESDLRNVGEYDILYKRVKCDYGDQDIAFHIDPGSTAFWLSFTIKYLGGPGDIMSVQIRHNDEKDFQPAKHNWGANWMLINTMGKPFKGPYAIKVICKLNGHEVVADDVIPHYFEPGQIYESKVQIKD